MGKAGPSRLGVASEEAAPPDPARDFLLKTANERLSSAFGGGGRFEQCLFSMLCMLATDRCR